ESEFMFSRKVIVPALLLSLVTASGVSAKTKPQQSSATKKKPAASGTKSSSTASKAGSSKTGAAARSGSSKTGTSKTGSAGTRASVKRNSKSSRKRGQQAPTTDRISEIQTALAKDGSFKGTPNGKWDDSTVDAVKKFQAAHGMNPTGRLDAPTLQKLGLGSSTSGVAAPQGPPGAVSRLNTSTFNQATSSDQQ